MRRVNVIRLSSPDGEGRMHVERGRGSESLGGIRVRPRPQKRTRNVKIFGISET